MTNPEPIGAILPRNLGLTPEQMKTRRGRITASILPAIVGVSPWEGPLDAWLRIMGKFQQPPTAATNSGHRMERWIVMEAASECGARDLWIPGTVVHPTLKWLAASPDAAAGPKPAMDIVFEAKLVGDHSAELWEDGVPDHVTVQGVGQMACTGARECHVAAMIGGNDYRHVVVERDLEVEELVIEQAEDFYRRYVLTGTPPPWDDTATKHSLQRLFGRTNGTVIRAPPTADELVDRYMDLSGIIDEAKAQRNAVKAELCTLIGEHDGMFSHRYSVSWKWREPTEVVYTRDAYRHFDLKLKKGKQ